jgi:hypothetical protein
MLLTRRLSMMAKGLHLQGDEPPDSSELKSQEHGEVTSPSEWPYMAFVVGVFLLITVKSLLF